MTATADQVLDFWLNKCTPQDWYKSDAAFDADIRARFEGAWADAKAGKLSKWKTYPKGALALIILTDQFSRNMFRDTGQAFETDRIALASAKQAIDRGWDMQIDVPARQFFYLPLMHSEILCDQSRCIRLMAERMPGHEGSLLHAKAHREVIRRFGRFPYRNEALARRSTEPELAYVQNGGYGSTVRELQQAMGA